MKNLLLFAALFFTAQLAFAQPINDDCAGIIDLGVVPICPTGIYTNVDATASDIGNDNIPNCFNGGNVDRDVWFQFTTDGTILDYTITVTGVDDGMGSTPMLNPQIEVYRGDLCGFDELASLQVCASANNGDDFVSTTLLGLDPNTVYYIRVNDYTATATPNSGTFEFCITEFIPDINICDGPGTTSCSGTLYDCGGPDMDYGNNENFVYTICPSEFHECILIDIVDFNIENNFDNLNIYAGDDINAPLLATLSGVGSGTNFQIQASSNCVTVQFISDGSATFSGFELDWLCVSFPCSGSSEDTPEVITNLPFSDDDSSCGEASTIGDSPCPDDDFLNGPDYWYIYDSPGDICVSIEITNADFGTGVLVFDGPPSDPSTNCVAQGQAGTIGSANMETAGTYYIVVANGAGCTDFDINIVETDCNLSPALVDALCNPLNGCLEFNGGSSVPSVFNLDIGFEDIPITQGSNQGCYLGIGAGNFYWFTIQAQANGPFGFWVQGENFQSDIDMSVWGPFTEEEVCDMPNDVIDFITNNQPIRSTWAGGADPTGLADIHPVTGLPVTDEFDCGSPATPGAGGDDFVSTIAAQTDEVYVVLINDWGGQIVDGVIMVDWSPSDPDVLDPLPIDIVGGDTTICIGDTATIEIDVALNDIEWLTNTSTLSCDNCPDPEAYPTETTIYQAVVNGVCNSDTIDVKVSVFDVDAGPDFTVCLGEDVQIVAGSEFDNATYEWTGPNLGDLSCTDCPDPILTTSTAGNITYTVTLNGPGCILTDEVTINVLSDPAPMFDVVADTVQLCIGENTDLGSPSNPGGMTYSWTSDPVGFTSAGSNPNVSPLQTTTYYLEVQNGLCPVPSFDSVFVEVSTPPNINVNGDTLVCQGESVSLADFTAEPGVTYQWDPATGLDFDDIPNPTATISGTETYTLTATNGACVETASITVTSTVISVDIQEPDSLLICKGEEVELTADAAPFGTNVVWTPADGSITPTTGLTVTATPGIATTYYASVNVPGCTQFDSIYIDVDSIPLDMTILPSDTSVCEGTLVILTSPTYEPADFPEVSHQWTPNIGLQSSDTLFNIVIEALSTQTYYRLTTNGICSQLDSATITVEPASEIMIIPGDTTICNEGDIQLLATSPDVTEFEWSSDNGTISCNNCDDPIASVSGPGTYTFTASGEFMDCPIEASTTIEVIAEPVESVIDDVSICIGDAVTLNTSTDPNPGTTYSWTANPPDPTLIGNESEPTVTPNQTTTYSVIIDNGICDPITEEVTIFVANDPIISVSQDTTICAEEEVTLTATSSENVGTFTWSNGETGPSIVVAPENTTTYTVTYSYSCEDGVIIEITDDVTVNVIPSFNVSIIPSANDTMFAEGQEIVLTAVTDPELIGAIYVWSTGQTGQTINATITQTPQEGFGVTVTNAEGCTGEDFDTYDIEEALYEFPNAFTPDNDEQNDYFNIVVNGDVELSIFRIYDRWGELVYDNDNPGQGWDGKKGDKDMPADVYIYYAIIKRASGEEFTEKGDLILIR